MKLKNVHKTFAVLAGLTAIALMTFTPVCLPARAAMGLHQPPAKRTSSIKYSGTLQPVGDEPRASGVVKETVTHGTASLSFNGSVSCKGLMPGVTYELWATNAVRNFDFRNQAADARGTVQFGFSGMYGPSDGFPTEFEVYRIEPTGNVLVLSGHI